MCYNVDIVFTEVEKKGIPGIVTVRKYRLQTEQKKLKSGEERFDSNLKIDLKSHHKHIIKKMQT